MVTFSGTVRAYDLNQSPASPQYFDGRWQLGDAHQLVADLQGTADRQSLADLTSAGQKERKFGGDALSVQWAFKSGKWYAQARFNRTEDTVRAGSDFNTEIGNRHTQVMVGRSWNGSKNGLWSSKTLLTSYEVRRTNQGQTLADLCSAKFGVAGPKQSRIELTIDTGREFQASRLINLDRMTFSGRIRPLENVEMGIESRSGDSIDVTHTRLADQERLQPFLLWHIRKNLSLHLNNTVVNLETKAGDEILDASLMDARLNWQLGDGESIQLTLQQQEIERNPEAYTVSVNVHTKDVGSKLLYSWKLNSKTEFHFGYSDSFVENNQVDLPATAEQNWFMSIGYKLGP